MSGHLPQSTYSQVSKALCGKENATPDELLQAVDQLKSQNAALLYDMVHVASVELCEACIHSREYAPCEEHDFNCEECPEECPCKTCGDSKSSFVHRGPCKENMKA